MHRSRTRPNFHHLPKPTQMLAASTPFLPPPSTCELEKVQSRCHGEVIGGITMLRNRVGEHSRLFSSVAGVF